MSANLSTQVAAIKAVILKTNFQTLVDNVQLLGQPGRVIVDGAGAVTVAGRSLSDVEYYILGGQLGLTP